MAVYHLTLPSKHLPSAVIQPQCNPHIVTTIVKWVTFVIVSVLVATTSYAKTEVDLYAWQTQVPDALSPLNNNVNTLASLTNNGVLFYPHPSKTVQLYSYDNNKPSTHFNKPVAFVSASVVLNASVTEVKKTLSDYQNYTKIFPKLTTSNVLEQQNNLARVQYRMVIDTDVPVLSFDEKFIMRHQITGNRLSTWFEDTPIKYGMGDFTWYKIDNNHTLLTLTHWGDLNNMRGLLLSTIVNALPELKVAVPHSVSGYILEALRLHFNGNDKVKTYQQPNIVPQWQVSKANQKILQQLVRHSNTYPVMYAHPPRKLAGETNLRFVSSLQRIPSPQPKLNALVFDPKQYPSMIKQIKNVTTTPYKKGVLVNSTIRVGLGVLSIPFNAKIYMQKPTANSAIISAQGGDVRWVEGRMTSYSLGKNTSLLANTFTSKTDKNAPFLLRIAHAFPYYDYLGSVGTMPVLNNKIKQQLAKE